MPPDLDLVRDLGGRADAPALVLVHPGAIPADHYRALAEAVGADYRTRVVDLERLPEYFQAALTGGHAALSIDQIAGRVLAELRAAGLLGGHWLLAGWSFGGVVAHALTGRLAEAELPDRVVLLDSIAPVPAYTTTDDELRVELVLRWFAMYLAAKRGAPVPVNPADLGPDLATGLALVLDAGLATGALRPGTALPGLRKLFDTYADGLLRNNRLAAAHTPPEARTPVTLVRPAGGLLSTPDPLGWAELATDLTVVPCPGDHYSMLADPDAVIAIAGLLTPTASARP